jgi:hypothetical protein
LSVQPSSPSLLQRKSRRKTKYQLKENIFFDEKLKGFIGEKIENEDKHSKILV